MWYFRTHRCGISGHIHTDVCVHTDGTSGQGSIDTCGIALIRVASQDTCIHVAPQDHDALIHTWEDVSIHVAKRDFMWLNATSPCV